MRSARPDLNVEVLGVNLSTRSAYNSYITYLGLALPWLQDSAEKNVWGQWDVVYRDVRILDSANRVVSVYNLSLHDLGRTENRAALRELFLAAAKALDTDADRLPDDWEILHFGGLTALPDGDDDADGADNFAEFAFASDPRDATSMPRMATRWVGPAGRRVFNATFRRSAGGMANYVVETSSDLITWAAAVRDPSPRPSRNLADGSGAAEAIYAYSAGARGQPQNFLRVLATPR